MGLLVQLQLSNINHKGNLPEEDGKEELPAIGMGQKEQIDTDHQSVKQIPIY